MIAVVCHDAGGAEILSSWLRHSAEPFCLVLDGPAINIFKRKLGYCSIITLSDAVRQSDWILCGTSWQSNLERIAIIQAKAEGKKVIAFLDHWVNYAERFQENGVSLFPDEIWVGDIDAERIARKLFPVLSIVLKSNPYFRDLQLEFESLPAGKGYAVNGSVLYVCEPIREHALLQYGDERYWGYTEEEALNYFANNLNALGCAVSSIKIRPHPSESRRKYDWIKEQFPSLKVEIGGDKTLLEEIAESSVVVGCESMAMVVALIAKKRVISSIPPGGKSCSLPQSEIEHLQVLIVSDQGTLHV